MTSSLEDTRMALLQERDMIPINFELMLDYSKDSLFGVMGYKSRSEFGDIEKYVKRIRNGKNVLANPASFSKICLDFHGKDLLVAIYYLGVLDGLRNELIRSLRADKVALAGKNFNLQQEVFLLRTELNGWEKWEQNTRRENERQLAKNRELRQRMKELNVQVNVTLDKKQNRKRVTAKPKATKRKTTKK
jgi:hypothetical protein